MKAGDPILNDEIDQSIITGLGRNSNLTVDDDCILDMAGPPQATSTVGNKKSREDLARKYLIALEEASEGFSDGSGQFKNTVGSSQIANKDHSQSHRTVLESLAVSEKRIHSTLQGKSLTREPSCFGSMLDVPLINIDNLSGLSTSRFLVDHTNLSTGEISKMSTAVRQFYVCDAKKQEERKDKLIRSPPPEVVQIDSDTDLSGGEDSDLSQGKVEDLLPSGLDGKYLQHSLDIMRCQDPHMSQDRSYALSTHTEAKGWHSDSTAGDVEGWIEGLPSTLLQPQHSLLNECNEKEIDSLSKLASREWDTRDEVLKTASFDDDYDDDAFVSNKVRFDAGQISARSTIFGNELEESKLLSTSCNSLGSFGEAVSKLDENDFYDENRGDSNDWFKADQVELAREFEGEAFHAPNLDFLEEEEKENCEAFKFIEEDACTNNQLDFSCFSGIHGVAEITVRPSWIISPDKKLVGPGNKMLVEDYLKSRSEALGSLGEETEENRPNFGKAVHSPPAAGKPYPLIEITMEDSQMLQSYSQSALKEEQETKASEKAAEFNRDSKKNSGSSGSDTYCNSEVSENLTAKTMASYTHKKESLSNNNSVPVKTDYSWSNDEATPKICPKDLIGSYLGEINVNTTNHQESFFKTTEKSHQSREEPTTKNLSTIDTNKMLEKTLNDIKGPISAEMINCFLSDALVRDNPQALIEKIIQMTQEKSVLHKTLDVTDLDVSAEVLELRRRREVLQSKQQTKIDHKAEAKSVGKESIGREATQKLVNNSETKFLQPPQSSCMPKPITGIPHKHMEKLKASRTNSAPGEATYSHQSKIMSNDLQTKFDDTNVDESIKLVQYKSTILEDTHKLQLPSFLEGNSGGFDSSTPCAPRPKSRSNISPLSDKPQEKGGGQTAVENCKQIIHPATQRALPRMGLSSSSVKMPVALNQIKVPAQLGRGPSVVSDKSHTRGIQNPVSNHKFASPQTSELQATNASSSSNATDAPTIRSTSVPAGLQSLGVAAGVVPVNYQSVNYIQTFRQHHSQENIAQETDSGESLNLPQQVLFPNVCVLGIASEVAINFHNPSPRWKQVSIKLVQETVDRFPTSVSGLLFKPSYFIEPRNKCEIKLGVCSQFKGLLEAILEVQMSDLTKGSGTSVAASQVSVQTLIVCAKINEPDVQLTCDGEDLLDFGVVPEGCIISREVTLINHSPQTLPVILNLQQVAVTSPIFYWNSNKNEFAKLISPTHLALELPAACVDSGPVPQTLTVTLKAPHLGNVKVSESGVVGVKSHLQVELDTPDNSTMIIAAFPVKAHIGAVRLEALRTTESLVVETMSDDSGTAPVTLKNSSTFGLRISFRLREYKDVFTVHPSVIVIQPHSQASLSLVFSPKGQVGRMESVLLMHVEPEGMEFEVSIAGVSHTRSTALVQPGKYLMPSVRETLTKSMSAPLPQVTEKDLSSALESNRSRIVFGTVSIGGTSSQKLVLRNNCTTQTLSLTLGISGTKAFQVGVLGSNKGQSRMDVVLKPCQEFALSLFLCPTAIEPLSGTLVCKFRGVVNLHKCKIPLQGYGGKSELMIPDSCDGKPLTVRELAPGLPAILQTAFLNKGDRAMFLKLQLFTDDQCSELLSLSDITIQPSEFILAPRENRDVFIVVNGTANILAKTPGCLGVLQVISGDEILRRRFRRLQNKEVKVRRINDPDLLKINWGVAYSREKEVQVEDDCLPPQPEDSVNFFNSCSKIQVQLYGERQTNDDASSTVFACLETEDTIGSMADITAANDKITEVHSPPVQGSVFHLPHKSQPAANIETGRTITWDVFPQTLSVPASDMSTLVFFVVNFSEVQQMFEVSSDCRWLDIEPREAILLSLSSVKVCVKLSPSRMPQSIVAPLTQSLKIMCENESRCAKITVLPTGGGDEDLQPQAVPSLQSQAAPHPPTLPKSTTGNLFHMKEASTDPQGHEIKALAVKYNSMPTASKTSQKVSGDSDLNLMDSAKSLVEVVSDNVIFPNTSTMKENYVKVKLRNLDGVIHTVKAEISQGPFTVRHTQFRIKSGHYVSVPVYFRPQTTGLFSCHLKLTVLEDKKVLTVQLSGRAVH